jgi:hypothetical protein
LQPTSHAYGPYWAVGDGYVTTLFLQNNDPQNPEGVKVTLFSRDGKTQWTARLRVAAASSATFDIGQIINAAAGTFNWGGMVLDFDGLVPQVVGDVILGFTPNGTTFHLPIQGGYQFDTENALYAPWFLPDTTTDARITLFNTSKRGIVVTPFLTVAGVEESDDRVILGPHETKQVNLKALIQKKQAQGRNVGLITLRYNGPPHALQPALLLLNAASPFSLAPAFNAKHDKPTGQTTVAFPSVSIAQRIPVFPSQVLTTYAVISNGTRTRFTPQLVAYFPGPPGTAIQRRAVPVDSLMPLETRLINLSQILGPPLIANGVTRFALTARHNGEPGDLGISVFSLNRNTRPMFRSRGIVLPPGTMDASYWSMDTGTDVLSAVENLTGTDSQARVTLYYQLSDGAPVGSYSLPLMDVLGNGGEVLDPALQTGGPDENGKRIPASVTSGIMALAVENQSQNDATAKHFAAECPTDCGPTPLWPTLTAGGIETIRFSSQIVAPATPSPTPTTCKPDFTISDPQTVQDGRNGSFNLTVTGGNPIGYQWSFIAPGGAGNNPEVTFSAPTATQTSTDAHWFAKPNDECLNRDLSTAKSKYDIKAEVTFDLNGKAIKKNKKTSLTVSLPIPGGKTGVGISGNPTIGQTGPTQWIVVNSGTLSRDIDEEIRMDQTSQFYNKIRAHEDIHYQQLRTGKSKDYYLISNLMTVLMRLTGTSDQDLRNKIESAITSWMASETTRFKATVCNDSEIEAYATSDTLDPKYFYDRCLRQTFDNCQ